MLNNELLLDAAALVNSNEAEIAQLQADDTVQNFV